LQGLRLHGRDLGRKTCATPTGTEQQGQAKTKNKSASRKMGHCD
jgi:hypothetical protein